jgi:hypothetical protein
VAGISSFRPPVRRAHGRGGVALWSSARAFSSAVPGLPGARIVERRDGRGEPVAQEEPAPSDPPRGQIAATCELVHGGARDAEQVGHLPGRHDVCAGQRARDWRSHLPKRGPEPPKRTPGGPTSAGTSLPTNGAPGAPQAMGVRRPTTWRAATFRGFRHHAKGEVLTATRYRRVPCRRAPVATTSRRADRPLQSVVSALPTRPRQAQGLRDSGGCSGAGRERVSGPAPPRGPYP